MGASACDKSDNLNETHENTKDKIQQIKRPQGRIRNPLNMIRKNRRNQGIRPTPEHPQPKKLAGRNTKEFQRVCRGAVLNLLVVRKED